MKPAPGVFRGEKWFDSPAFCRKLRCMKTAVSQSPPKPVTERLEARVPRPIKSLIDRAAALEGLSITDYVIATLERDAAKVVHEHEILHLTTADSQSFAKSMISPPKPGSALKSAFARHAKAVTAR
jgi:uncharacterized protein (DUF1778 family)